MKTITIALFIFLAASCKHSDYTPPHDPLFKKLTAAECGIDFRNDITDDSAFNEISYRNIYNGGGVAIGDINNDGLPDVFMTANQGKNKLFLNKGHLHFEDITDKAGIVKTQKWSTGVVMADVNGDGFLDIYVCAAGAISGDKRRNALYINHGNGHFTEEADKYHLADEGAYHTQAAFFDYDRDGDLDVFLLNNDGTVPNGNYPNASMRNFRNRITGDKLLRNDNGVFTDVTDSSGIFGAAFGFGLGVTIADLNGDNWPDLYISNDFYEKDYVYINQRNGKFRELSDSCLGHMPQTSMGADIADINNDGLADIFTTDMLPEDDYRLKKNTIFDNYDTYNRRSRAGYHHQITSNMLQLNNGDNTFSEIAQYAGVAATDWSWGSLIFDMNNDGWKDLLVCNGMYLDVTDQDYAEFVANEDKAYFLGRKALSNFQLLKKIPVSKPLSNYAFLNQRNLTFANYSYDLGLAEPGFSNGAAYADLDGDGDLDLVVNNLNSDCYVYQNTTSEKYKKSFLRVQLQGTGRNTSGIGASVTIYAGGKKQVLQNFPARGFQSCVEPILSFGLDSITRLDSLIVVWPDDRCQRLANVDAKKIVLLKQTDANEKFSIHAVTAPPLFSNITSTTITGNIRHRQNDFIDFYREHLMPHLLSTEGPKMAVADIDGDGLEDFVVGSAKHDTTKVFLQTKDGNFRQLAQPAFDRDAEFTDAGMVFLDVDKDGDQDLLITSGGNLDKTGSSLLQPRLYLNNGKGRFEWDRGQMPVLSVNASCVKAIGLNGDGYPDVFIGGRSLPGEYGVSPRSYLLRNDHGVLSDVTAQLAPELMTVGMVTDAVWADLDNDGKEELIVVGEWMPITVFTSENGHLVLSKTLNEQFAFTNGWWNCIKAVDLDNDGKLDLIAGNLGLNTKLKADSLHPAELYVNDFDKNGKQECVLSYYKSDGKSYPYYLKGDLVSQIPILKKKFLRNIDYAGKTIDEIFDKEQLASSDRKKAYEFRSCIFMNKGKGAFEKVPMPMEAQLSPIYTIFSADIDHDGWKDLVLAGNLFGLKPELGRYDASYGVFYKGGPKRQLSYLTPAESGFFYRGEARDLLSIKNAAGKNLLLLSRNDDSLLIFKHN